MDCMCGGCLDCLRAQQVCNEDDDAIETIAGLILDEYLSSADWIGKADCDLVEEDRKQIDAAHAERNSEKLFAVRDAAIRRVLSAWAHEKAREQLDVLRKEDERDAAELRTAA